nr:T9SS type A sorting domain-containing protein [Bacteroidota bacterium]
EGERMDLSAGEWKAQLVLKSKSGNDALNYIGVLSTARDGWDEDDFVKPPSSPSMGTAVTMNNLGVRLSADFRAFNPSGNIWDCTVSGSEADGPLRLSVDLTGSLPEGFTLYIIDLAAERIYDTRTVPSFEFSFTQRETARRFRLVAGTEGFIEEHSNGIPLVPMEYALSQNFPNPFNPVTTIQYTLANSGRVQLEIFNILGQNVRTLVDSDQNIGAYAVVWDGKDNHGILLSSGIYYYQIRSKEYRSARKMTFVK